MTEKAEKVVDELMGKGVSVLTDPIKTVVTMIYNIGFEAGKTAGMAISAGIAKDNEAEDVETETSIDDDQTEKIEPVFVPGDYRHGADGSSDDNLLCGSDPTGCELTTGNRINCPKCLAVIEAAATAAKEE